jgi:hypothetical protein
VNEDGWVHRFASAYVAEYQRRLDLGLRAMKAG